MTLLIAKIGDAKLTQSARAPENLILIQGLIRQQNSKLLACVSLLVWIHEPDLCPAGQLLKQCWQRDNLLVGAIAHHVDYEQQNDVQDELLIAGHAV